MAVIGGGGKIGILHPYGVMVGAACHLRRLHDTVLHVANRLKDVVHHRDSPKVHKILSFSTLIWSIL